MLLSVCINSYSGIGVARQKKLYLRSVMTIALKNKIALINSFIDEAFDVKKTTSFQLVIQIGMDGVLLAVNEKDKHKYIAFENYTFQNLYNFDAIGDSLDELLKESKLLNNKYKAVTCLVVNNLSTLVPNALFEEDRIKMYLKFNTTLEGNEFVIADELKSIDIKNIFALPLALKVKLDQLFNNVNYHHFSSGLIDSLLIQNKNQTTKKLFVHVQATHFEALVVEGNKLLFYNTFNHHSAEDFIYYLLFVCEQLQLNPEKVDTVFLGEIEKESAIYSIAQKYIRNIKFGERTDNADYSYQLQTFPKHFYFTLFNRYFT